jgi:hypothetical protein
MSHHHQWDEIYLFAILTVLSALLFYSHIELRPENVTVMSSVVNSTASVPALDKSAPDSGDHS